ncbi:hypothetical protein J6590_051051 [Homalodisca vitripennis]|nr:hypothetical protein J6590_051051 [Homalodisca vitripennis]
MNQQELQKPLLDHIIVDRSDEIKRTRDVTYTGTRLEAEITTVMEDTERWFMSTCPPRQVFISSTDCQNSRENAQTPKTLKARLKRFLVSNSFYSVDEFLAFNWKTT